MEEKKFFVKDFIKYCSPCFACDRLMTFRLGWNDEKTENTVLDKDIVRHSTMTVITDEYVEAELIIRYQSNLKIWIYHRTNKVVASDQHRFNEYAAHKDLCLVSQCSCQSTIISKPLDFQRYNGVVAPTSLRWEEFHIAHKNKRYLLESDFVAAKSIGSIRTYTAPGVSRPDLRWEMKLLPKYKLGNRQKLIDKLNIYATFS